MSPLHSELRTGDLLGDSIMLGSGSACTRVLSFGYRYPPTLENVPFRSYAAPDFLHIVVNVPTRLVVSTCMRERAVRLLRRTIPTFEPGSRG